MCKVFKAKTEDLECLDLEGQYLTFLIFLSFLHDHLYSSAQSELFSRTFEGHCDLKNKNPEMLLLHWQRVWDSVLLYQEWLPDNCPSIETISDDALMDDLKKKNIIRYFYLCITASKITAFLDSWKQDRRSSV